MKKNNTKYYDSVASNYDSLLNEDKSIKTRKIVENYFTKNVKNKSAVLDFGGGTGLDLNWLTKEDYTIVFCEPSVKMRSLAKEKDLPNKLTPVTFLNDNLVNFQNWTELSFKLKIDAVLSNFAVINSIDDLKLLAKQLNSITNIEADLFFLVLFRTPKNKINSFYNAFLNINFILNPLSRKISISNDNVNHNIILYSLKSIKNSFKPYFKIKNVVPISDTCFKLIHLKKRN